MARSCLVTVGISTCLVVHASAGAALVNGDFQTGALAPSTSAFVLDAGMTPAGTYNIATFDTYHPSWVDFFDHTEGDSTGRFMVANGLSGTGGMAWAQTVSVSPGTDYSLSAWFASVYGFAVASLKFKIVGDSTIDGPTFSAPGTTATWVESSYTFNTGTSTSISVQIWDVTGVGDGNDYAIDDITLTEVPGPATIAGLAGLMFARRRR